MSSSQVSSPSSKYKGVRQRKWGKWVSEIRVPGTPERLWLGSYATPEAAATAHDVAYYCLRGGDSSLQSLNFPLTNLPAGVRVGISPRSVQKVASDAGLAVDARLKLGQAQKVEGQHEHQSDYNDNNMIWQQQHCVSWGRTSNNDWWHTSGSDQEHLTLNNDWWHTSGSDQEHLTLNNDWWHTSGRDQEQLSISVEDYI